MGVYSCSKDLEEDIDKIGTIIEEPLPEEDPAAQEETVERSVYSFVEEFVVENGVQHPVPTLCPVSFNTVQVGGGIIIIQTDCALTDGYFEAQVTNMEFVTDEILVLGTHGVLSWPKTVKIEVCNENSIALTHARPELGQVFWFIYES